MSETYSSAAVIGFLEEAAVCLPEIRQGLSAYAENSEPGGDLSQALAEPCRLARKLYDASSFAGPASVQEIHRRTASLHKSLEELLDKKSIAGELSEIETAIGLLAELDEIEHALEEVDPNEAPAPEPQETLDRMPDPELLEVYTMEAEDHLRSMTSGLSALDQDPENSESLQDVRRSVHTLKGAANVVGLKTIAGLAHRMEDLLDFLYERAERVSPEALSTLFTATELLENMGKESPGQFRDSVDQLYARLDSLIPERDSREAMASAVTSDETDSLNEEHPAEAAAASSAGEGTESPARAAVKVIRVPLPRLDGLVKLASELVINRNVLEQRIKDLEKQVEELQRSSERLKSVSYKLEGSYEAAALGSLSPALPAAGETSAFGHASGSDASRRGVDGFDELEFDRYTAFHQTTRELSEATADAGDIANELDGFVGDFDTLLNRQRNLTNEIQDGLLKVRMLPIRVLTARLDRTIRVTADQEGKKAAFVMEGGNVEMDTTVIEQIVDPLLHLLRNAVAHGIESPETRRRLGKSERATISLRAFHENSNVVIEVSDDGRGLDFDAIRRKAVQIGHAPSADAAMSMTELELQRLIFLPGFSTARTISEISGRGVGLDAVHEIVRKLRGVLSVDSTPGLGVTFTLRFPITLTVAKALLVETAGRTFAVQLNNIRQLLRIDRDQIERLGDVEIFREGKKAYPLFHLRRTLNLGGTEGLPLRPVVLIVRLPAGEVAIAVDAIQKGMEIVIKSLGSHLRHVYGVLGATLLGDGRVVPILNLDELYMDEIAPVHRDAAAQAAGAAPKTATVMIVDDSPSIRRVNAILIQGEGWTPVTAKDGLDALEQLHRMAEPPRAILLDVEMPRMDGYELLAALKREPAYQDVPVVMITSRSGEKHRRKALDLGASEYVTKPYQDQALLKRLRHLVN